MKTETVVNHPDRVFNLGLCVVDVDTGRIMYEYLDSPTGSVCQFECMVVDNVLKPNSTFTPEFLSSLLDVKHETKEQQRHDRPDTSTAEDQPVHTRPNLSTWASSKGRDDNSEIKKIEYTEQMRKEDIEFFRRITGPVNNPYRSPIYRAAAKGYAVCGVPEDSALEEPTD